MSEFEPNLQFNLNKQIEFVEQRLSILDLDYQNLLAHTAELVEVIAELRHDLGKETGNETQQLILADLETELKAAQTNIENNQSAYKIVEAKFKQLKVSREASNN